MTIPATFKDELVAYWKRLGQVVHVMWGQHTHMTLKHNLVPYAKDQLDNDTCTTLSSKISHVQRYKAQQATPMCVCVCVYCGPVSWQYL